LREGLGRLQATTIVTNIRVKKGKKHRQFSWIESWTDLLDDETGQSKGMTLTLSDWFYEGILMDGGLLAIDPAYFSITGGRERWLYRVARKHAGGAGEGGFAIPLPTLFEKSGAEGNYRRFKFEMLALVRSNELPGFDLGLELTTAEPTLRMTRRDLTDGQNRLAKHRRAGERRPATAPAAAPPPLPLFRDRALTDDTIASVRRDFPGWDIYALKADFDAWIDGKNGRDPHDYQAAFYGFARQFHKREGR
jgi:plasmid replication initiation protein